LCADFPPVTKIVLVLKIENPKWSDYLCKLGHFVLKLMGEIVSVGEGVNVAAQIALVQQRLVFDALNELLLLFVHIVLQNSNSVF
jgi:hypothetical protein